MKPIRYLVVILVVLLYHAYLKAKWLLGKVFFLIGAALIFLIHPRRY